MSNLNTKNQDQLAVIIIGMIQDNISGSSIFFSPQSVVDTMREKLSELMGTEYGTEKEIEIQAMVIVINYHAVMGSRIKTKFASEMLTEILS